MATNFPGSQDSFTNPTSSDTLDSPDHAAQHTNVNDAVEAIELALLDGAPLKIDDTNERVGIGTTSPSTTFDVADALLAKSISTSSEAVLELKASYSQLQLTDTDDSTFIHYSYSGGKLRHRYNDYSANEFFTLDGPNQRVGIGTGSPSAKLDVESAGLAGSPTLSVTTTNSDAYNHAIEALNPNLTAGEGNIIVVGRAGSTKNAGYLGYQYSSAGSDNNLLSLGHWGNNWLLNMKGNGDVGIGTTSPSYKLEVNGTGAFMSNLRVHANGGAILTLRDTGATNTAGHVEYESSNGTTMGYIGFGNNDDIHIYNAQSNGYIYFRSGNNWRAYFNNSGHFLPYATNTYDLGSSSLRWRNIYTQDLHLSNGIGDYTVVEGEEDLYLTNNLTGKAFKFALIEVEPSEVPDKSLVG